MIKIPDGALFINSPNTTFFKVRQNNWCVVVSSIKSSRPFFSFAPNCDTVLSSSVAICERPYVHGGKPEEVGTGPTHNQQINNGPLCSIICWAIKVLNWALQYGTGGWNTKYNAIPLYSQSFFYDVVFFFLFVFLHSFIHLWTMFEMHK